MRMILNTSASGFSTVPALTSTNKVRNQSCTHLVLTQAHADYPPRELFRVLRRSWPARRCRAVPAARSCRALMCAESSHIEQWLGLERSRSRYASHGRRRRILPPTCACALLVRLVRLGHLAQACCMGAFGQIGVFDSTSTDLYLTSMWDRTKKLSPATRTLLLEQISTAILGWYVGFEKPSASVALQAILCGAESPEAKVEICKRYGVESIPEDWITGLSRLGILADRLKFDGQQIDLGLMTSYCSESDLGAQLRSELLHAGISIALINGLIAESTEGAAIRVAPATITTTRKAIDCISMGLLERMDRTPGWSEKPWVKRALWHRGRKGLLPSCTDGEPVESAAKEVAGSRRRLGLSAPQFGKLIGVRADAVHDWETGHSQPHRKHLEKIVELRSLRSQDVHKRLAGLRPSAQKRGGS